MKVNGKSVVVLLDEAGDKYMSATAVYNSIFMALKGKGVKFADISDHMHQMMKKEGLWSTQDDLKRADALDKNWYKKMHLFLTWVKRNWVSYEERKKLASSRPKNKLRKDKKKDKQPVDMAKFQKRLERILKDQPEVLDTLADFLKENGYKVEKEEN